MSKAFTKESETEPDEELEDAAPLPAGQVSGCHGHAVTSSELGYLLRGLKGNPTGGDAPPGERYETHLRRAGPEGKG